MREAKLGKKRFIDRSMALSTASSTGLLGPCGEDDRGQADQAADGGGVVTFRAGTAFRGQPPGMVGEEVPVIGLGIGVVVAVGSGHEGDVVPQEADRVTTARGREATQQDPDAQQVEGIVPPPHAAVIMGVGPTPVALLALEDETADDLALLGTAPRPPGAGQGHDGVGMVLKRCLVVPDEAVVAPQGGHVVIPVRRHGQRIADEQAPEGATQAVSDG